MKSNKPSGISKETLEDIESFTIKKMKDYIKKHRECDVLDMVKKKITTACFIESHVVCTKCGHIERKAVYAIAQKTMGHDVTYNCNCGNKIIL